MIEEGVYIEEKQTTVGVAGTSKSVVFKNIWATREVGEASATLQLLDDKGQPTPLIERVNQEEMRRRFVHRPLKPEVWQALKKKILATQPASLTPPKCSPPKKTAPASKTAPAPGSWWDLKR